MYELEPVKGWHGITYYCTSFVGCLFYSVYDFTVHRPSVSQLLLFHTNLLCLNSMFVYCTYINSIIVYYNQNVFKNHTKDHLFFKKLINCFIAILSSNGEVCCW